MACAMTARGDAAEPQAHGAHYLGGLMKQYAGRDQKRRRKVAVAILTAYPDVFRLADVAELVGVSVWTVKRDLRDAAAGLRLAAGRPLGVG